MSSRFTVLSFFLLVLVALLGYKNYEVWSEPSTVIPRKAPAKKGEAKAESGGLLAASGERPALDFLVIGQKNVFHPERKEFPVQMVTAAEQAKPVIRPQVILQGVVVADDYRVATIVNPGRPLMKGEREEKTVKIGDRIGEYKITRIQEDRIAMEASGDSFEVLLFDPKVPKRRIETRTASKPAAVNVTSAVSLPAAMPGQVPTLPPPMAVPPISPTPQPRPQPPTAVPVPRPSASPGDRTVGPSPGAISPPTAPAVPDGRIWRGRRGGATLPGSGQQ